MIEIKHLRKEFEDSAPLKDINMTINDGDVIAIIGPSGTGKSTLLRCINLLAEPTSGDIIVDGQNITDKHCDINEVRKKMGMVFQSFNLFGHMTILENIMKPQMTLLGRTKQEAYDKAMDLLYTVGLAAKALNYPSDLSGGQQQRIAIARTLAMDPEIILFDEPTSALDPSMIGEVQSVIRMLAKSGRTMMIVTHEMDFAKKIANRVILLNDGYIYDDGTPKEIFENPTKPLTRKFVQRLSVLSYSIRNTNFDFENFAEELQSYAEKLLIENDRTSKLQMCLEEICVNNLFILEDDIDIVFDIEYSEKKDELSLVVKYNGEHFNPFDSDNELFNSILNESTTVVHDEIRDPSDTKHQHKLELIFKWEEA
ncbi:MAG: amino acid ABC transporter ATP-binding protein [Bacillota bacterium]|nr:amino acid ABC transporter ATP-binding protein [Bacillota bacterium]